jgi:hypothetical protein
MMVDSSVRAVCLPVGYVDLAVLLLPLPLLGLLLLHQRVQRLLQRLGRTLLLACKTQTTAAGDQASSGDKAEKG